MDDDGRGMRQLLVKDTFMSYICMVMCKDTAIPNYHFYLLQIDIWRNASKRVLCSILLLLSLCSAACCCCRCRLLLLLACSCSSCSWLLLLWLGLLCFAAVRKTSGTTRRASFYILPHYHLMFVYQVQRSLPALITLSVCVMGISSVYIEVC